ncbi:uncharacterized protein STEHIDRAFT_170350 [Stereum hirsutum FP-91666 SS1]|uniref:uncharacterized protein n=1 Tax=Stereum hirsutum (strain FP-91666) TaxID=721885 RepID=UPI000444A58D|nr:uncharacterized protein STEHIDRAFT_170350 [Stereum hirsutum FP-91666 SS1]EIM83912.1 hypothetical protein STEHIDRAFT_170350 [Stereum hirsutum FP-91666 SS1]
MLYWYADRSGLPLPRPGIPQFSSEFRWHRKQETWHDHDAADLFPFGLSIATLALAIIMFILDVGFDNAVTARPPFELGVSCVLTTLWTAFNAFSTSRWANIPTNCNDIPSSYSDARTWCKDVGALKILVWINWSIILACFLLTTTYTLLQSRTHQNQIWRIPLSRFRPAPINDMFVSAGGIAAFDRATRVAPLYGGKEGNEKGEGAGELERKGSTGWWANGGSGFRGSLQSAVSGGKTKSTKGIRRGILPAGSDTNAAATTTLADGRIIVGGQGAEQFATNLNQTTDYGGVQVAVADYGYGNGGDDPFARSPRSMGGIGEDGRTIATGITEVPLGSPVTLQQNATGGGLLSPYYTPSTPNVAGMGYGGSVAGSGSAIGGDAGYPRWSGSDAYNVPSPGIVGSASGYPSRQSNAKTVSGYEDGLWSGNGLGEVVWKGTGKTQPSAAGPSAWQQQGSGGNGGGSPGGADSTSGSAYSVGSYYR